MTFFMPSLGWDGGIGYMFQVHGQEFNSFRRRTRARRLRDFVFVARKSFSTHWVQSINGSGNCG